jgi:hypothetical protein
MRRRREDPIHAALVGQERRLRDTFSRLLLLSLASPVGLASCSSSGATPGSTGDAAADASTLSEGSASTDGPGPAIVDATTAADVEISDAQTTDGDRADDGGAALADGSGDAASPVCSSATASSPMPLREIIDGAASVDPCRYQVTLSCAAYGVTAGSCYLAATDCLSVCPAEAGTVYGCSYTASTCSYTGSQLNFVSAPGQPATVTCEICPGVGRRPAGLLRPRRAETAGALGRYFALASHLEAASVLAFERMHDELRQHGAPRALRDAARASARDEVRHARATARVARRFGAEPPVVRARKPRPRSLERMARENAVEGCVRETFGALVATWQAARARDPQIRRSTARIAADETRHAALAWAVAAWAEARLDDAARARVERARQRAVARLREELGAGYPAEVRSEAGLPDPARARALLTGLAPLWHAA